MNNWEENPDWTQLAKPGVGDIVQLKLKDTFEYLVKTIVVAVEKDKITARVEALFDWHTRDWLTGGEKVSLLGKEISFSPRFVQTVIKKSATES